jgi:hypothetical protein
MELFSFMCRISLYLTIKGPGIGEFWSGKGEGNEKIFGNTGFGDGCGIRMVYPGGR